MEFDKLMLAEKIGKILAYAVKEKKYNRYELIQKWLSSETYDETVNFVVYLCSQTKTYILSQFEQEIADNLPSIDENSPFYEDDLYWFGYLTAYWFFIDNTTGREIVDKYNINHILDSFEILHTLDIRTAIDKIKEDDVL